MEEKWFVMAKRAPFAQIAEKFHIDPVTARLIRNRDVEGDEAIERYLYGGLECLHAPWKMKGIEEAAVLLEKKIRERRRIRVIGDYDIDGVCATYILLEGLRVLGAAVDWDIPDRVTDGYGLNVRLVKQALADGIDTILTCDNGIAAAKQIAYAKSCGMTVIVTDHHEVPFAEQDGEKRFLLPPADVVVDPKQADCPYPFPDICGAVVAWKLIQAMYERAHIGDEKGNLFLPYAAVATIGDVMELRDENRVIVKEGLRMLKEKAPQGLRALMEVNGVLPQELRAYHIGYVLGPCLNAGGRLQTAKLALALLQSRDRQAAIARAEDLRALNAQRKELTAQAVEQAKRQLAEDGTLQDMVLVVFLPDCHESIAGIVAGRLREAYHKPVFVLTRGEAALKGSGRSIEAYSMFEKLSACGDLLLQFGGHPMAAGLSIEEKNLSVLRKRLNAQCGLTETDFQENVHIDAAMPISYLREALVQEFSLLEPFGKGNAAPLFAEKNLRASGVQLVGKNKNVLRMTLTNIAGASVKAICFRDAQVLYTRIKDGALLTVAYSPQINEFRGRRTVELSILHVIVQEETVPVEL